MFKNSHTVKFWHKIIISTNLLQENNAISNQESIGSGPGKHEARMEDSLIRVVLNLNVIDLSKFKTAKGMKI